MHRNSNDNIVLCTIEIVVAAPDADYFKSGFPESTDHLLPGDSRELHVPALLVFRGTDISTGMGLPSFFGHLDIPRDRFLNLCQCLFPGIPLTDAPRERWHRYGVSSVLILLHKNRIANTGIRQIDPSAGELSLSLYKGFRKLSP